MRRVESSVAIHTATSTLDVNVVIIAGQANVDLGLVAAADSAVGTVVVVAVVFRTLLDHRNSNAATTSASAPSSRSTAPQRPSTPVNTPSTASGTTFAPPASGPSHGSGLSGRTGQADLSQPPSSQATARSTPTTTTGARAAPTATAAEARCGPAAIPTPTRQPVRHATPPYCCCSTVPVARTRQQPAACVHPPLHRAARLPPGCNHLCQQLLTAATSMATLRTRTHAPTPSRGSVPCVFLQSSQNIGSPHDHMKQIFKKQQTRNETLHLGFLS